MAIIIPATEIVKRFGMGRNCRYRETVQALEQRNSKYRGSEKQLLLVQRNSRLRGTKEQGYRGTEVL